MAPIHTLADLTDFCVPTVTSHKNLDKGIGRTPGLTSQRHKEVRREKGPKRRERSVATDQTRGGSRYKLTLGLSQNQVAYTCRQSGKYLSALQRDAFFFSFLFFSSYSERLTREKQDNHQHFDLSTSLGGFTGFCAH